MLKNYFKIAWRNLRQHPGYSLINIAGLAVGITCCMLIGLYVWHEWSYDSFHTKADRLYRLNYEHRIGTDLAPASDDEYKAWGSAAIAPLMEQELPEVEHAVRISGQHQILLSQGDESFQEEQYFFADPEFFEIFSYPLIEGDPVTALQLPNSIVLTENAARRYFNDRNAMGESLELGSGSSARTLTVTGIMENPPSNTHLDFNMLLSMSTFENEARANDQGYKFDNWGYIDFFTYVLLKEDASSQTLHSKFPDFVQRHHSDNLQDPPQSYSLKLEPITAAYLSPVSGFQPGPKGNETSLYLFAIISLFILLIAVVNFTNLATARSIGRAKEVGIRKTVGAHRAGLIGQFLVEAIILSVISMILAVALAQMIFPLFQDLAGQQIPASYLTSWPLVLTLVAATFLIGLLAGSYPAAMLSSFRPIQVLKGKFGGSREGVFLRKGLVVFQFTAAIALIAGTLIVREQLQYLQQQPLGFEDEQQLVLDFGGDGLILQNLESLKQELGQVSGVQNVSATRSIPGGYFPHATTRVESPDGSMREFNPGLYEVDTEFLKQIDVEAVAGRLFSREYESDAEKAILLNEAAVRHLGYSDPAAVIGKRFEQWGRTGQVVGVVNNFNYESLRHDVRPLAFRVSPWLNYFVLEVPSDEVSTVLSGVRDTWTNVASHRPFLYQFLDQSFDAQYRAEERFGALFGTFSTLAIFVACLGLFGLAAFTAQQRTKEIGIRKVMGASLSNITGLLSRDFVKLVLIGFLIAIPIAWLVMNNWLKEFAYRIEMGPGVFFLAGGIAVMIAIITISWQSIAAALANPVESLRSE